MPQNYPYSKPGASGNKQFGTGGFASGFGPNENKYEQKSNNPDNNTVHQGAIISSGPVSSLIGKRVGSHRMVK